MPESCLGPPGPPTSWCLALGLLPSCTLVTSPTPYHLCLACNEAVGPASHPFSAPCPSFMWGHQPASYYPPIRGLPAAQLRALCVPVEVEVRPLFRKGSAIFMRLSKSCKVPFPVKQHSLPGLIPNSSPSRTFAPDLYHRPPLITPICSTAKINAYEGLTTTLVLIVFSPLHADSVLPAAKKRLSLPLPPPGLSSGGRPPTTPSDSQVNYLPFSHWNLRSLGSWSLHWRMQAGALPPIHRVESH